MYEAIMGIGTVLIMFMVFTSYGHVTDVMRDKMIDITPSTVFNESVNTTITTGNYNLGFDVFYISLFFITVTVFVWIIKKAAQYQQYVR